MKADWKILLGTGLGLAAGLAIGVVTIRNIPEWNLQRDSIIYQITGTHKPEILGFLPYWMLNKANNDYNKYLNDVAYFAVVINDDGTIVKVNEKGEEEPGWNKLKSSGLSNFYTQYKGVEKTLVVQSGVEESISKLISEPKKNGENLVKEVIPLMKKYGFTNLNIDIESFRTGNETDQKNFTELVKTIDEGMKAEQMGEVSIDIPVTAFLKSTIVNPKNIQPYVDKVILMAYDFHYRGSMTSGPVAPIDGAGQVRESDVRMAVNLARETFKDEQLLLGIPLYGYEWETISKADEAAIIPGSGMTAYHKAAMDKIQNCTECEVRESESSKEKNIVSVDKETGSIHQTYFGDIKSMEEKIKMAKELRMGGVAFWALGYEDENLLKPFEEYKKFYWQN